MAAACRRRFALACNKLSRWLKEWLAVPQVVVPEGTEPPTALSWLRRRGPPLPEACLHRLFRQETVRVYDPASQRVGRASKGRVLPPGATLLLPKSAVAAAANGGANEDNICSSSSADSSDGSRSSSDGSSSGGSRSGDAGARGRPSTTQAQQAQQRWVAALRAGLLHCHPDFLAINKPAGLACQGGSGLSLSLDAIMGEAFGQLPGVQPRQLRLVHRLDRQTTGVLLIARNPDSAAWLSAAFKEGSLTSSGGGSSSSSRGSSRGSSSRARRTGEGAVSAVAPASISKTYWAVVAREGEGREEADEAEHQQEQRQHQPGSIRRSGSTGRGGAGVGSPPRGWLPREGSIRLPVPSSRDASELLPAETRFRVLHQGPCLAWLELQPGTGRKHQLRLHCARGLGAAVLGDSRYGALRGSSAQQAALAALRSSNGSDVAAGEAAGAGVGRSKGTAAAAAAGAAAGAAKVALGRRGTASSSSSFGSGGQVPLFLHCRRLEVRPPGRQQTQVEATAPLPAAWRALLEQQGWPLPDE